MVVLFAVPIVGSAFAFNVFQCPAPGPGSGSAEFMENRRTSMKIMNFHEKHCIFQKKYFSAARSSISLLERKKKEAKMKAPQGPSAGTVRRGEAALAMVTTRIGCAFFFFF